MTTQEHEAICSILSEAEYIWKQAWKDDMTKNDYVKVEYVDSTDSVVFCDLTFSKNGVEYSEEIDLSMHRVKQYMNKEITIKETVGYFT